MRFSHRDLIRREAEYPTGDRDGWAGYAAKMKARRTDFYREFRSAARPPQPDVNDILAAFDDLPPGAFAKPYDLDEAGIEHLARSVQKKYVVRFKNIRRSWAILLQHMPELMAPGTPPRDVLEMSTAHGATLEILRHKGHRVVGNDYANFVGLADVDTRFRRIGGVSLNGVADDHGLNEPGTDHRDWPYKPIVESLGLDVRLFDAGSLPYPFDDKSFDSVLCFDAIEHYCHPSDWMRIIGEFCRLARRSVLVITNPVQPFLLSDDDYMDAFHGFQRRIRNEPVAGFVCISAGVYRNQLTVFKLMREL